MACATIPRECALTCGANCSSNSDPRCRRVSDAGGPHTAEEAAPSESAAARCWLYVAKVRDVPTVAGVCAILQRRRPRAARKSWPLRRVDRGRECLAVCRGRERFAGYGARAGTGQRATAVQHRRRLAPRGHFAAGRCARSCETMRRGPRCWNGPRPTKRVPRRSSRWCASTTSRNRRIGSPRRDRPKNNWNPPSRTNASRPSDWRLGCGACYCSARPRQRPTHRMRWRRASVRWRSAAACRDHRVAS